jgi:hypothetical protein
VVVQWEEEPPERQSRYLATTRTRSPIRRSGSAGPGVVAVVVVGQGTLRVLARVPGHSPACHPSAGAAEAVAAARADMSSGPGAMCDGPVAAEDVVDDTDRRSAEAACHIHVGQVCFDNTRLRYLLDLEAGQGDWDLCSYAH